MDTNTVLDDRLESSGNIGLSISSIQSLRESARWAKFIAIVGFVMVGFMVLASFFIGAAFSDLAGINDSLSMAAAGGGIFMTVLYLLAAALYFFPCLFLYRFATKTKAALIEYDTNGVTEGLKQMKNYFQFIGIMIAILLGFYALVLVFGVIGGLFATF
ncbi:MAG: hypothetical protein AAF599_12745 [Bacteroidota bacterium]